MKSRKLSMLLVVCLLALSLGACTAAKTEEPVASDDNNVEASFEKMTWSAATSGAEGSNFAAGLEKFAEIVGEKTNGAVTVDIYTSDQLTNGNQADSLQGVMDGTIDMAFQDGGIWGNFDNRFSIITLPFFFTTFEDVDNKLINGEAGVYLTNILEDKFKVKALGIGENGFRFITNSKHEVQSPEDLKGLKLRVAGNAMLTGSYEAWGADYTVAPWAEVYTGLQTKLYDGQENPVAVADASSIQEVQKYMTKWTAHYTALYMTMNGDVYDGLSDELKAIVDEAGKEACAYQVQLTRRQNEELLEKWINEYDIQVCEMSAENVAKFKALSDKLYDEYPEGKELLELLQ